MHISKNEARKMMREKNGDYNLVTVIHCHKGIFAEQLTKTGPGETIKTFSFNNILGAYRVVAKINYNKYEDKMEVASSYLGYKNHNLVNQFMTDKDEAHETQWNRMSMTRLDRRVQIIGALTLGAIFRGSRIKGFSNVQKPSNRRFSTYGLKFREFLDGKVKLSGDIEQDFEVVFKFLWFNYPCELTGDDLNIKRTTLQEGLINMPIDMRVSTAW